jgi:hypothetical protein
MAAAARRESYAAIVPGQPVPRQRSPNATQSRSLTRMTQSLDPNDLETAILAVYQGPFEEFVSRRDALAKELRAAKRRDDADRVKALRKPSRTAWVLDTAVHEDPAAIEQLVQAINAAQTVQSGADLRAAMETIRAAVRAVAAVGARVAIRAGQPVDANVLSMALHAVIGETKAFEELCAGRLVDVPDGGGLDILTALPTLAPPPPRPPSPPTPSKPPASPPPPNAKADEQSAVREAERAAAAAARADLRRAETVLAEARKQSDRVERLVRDAESQLAAAEQALSRAESEARARHGDVERVRRDADAAAAQLRDAERAVAEARARIRP